MSMYDRDWYREAYREQERRNNSVKRSSGNNRMGMKPALFILLFAFVIAAIMSVARLYVPYPTTIGLIGHHIEFYREHWNGIIQEQGRKGTGCHH